MEDPASAPVRGVKGPSWIHLIPDLDSVEGLILESLHAVYIGVVGQLLKLWLLSTQIRPFHIDIGAFNAAIASVKVPAEVLKLPRAYSTDWKAHEKRNFLFFYSVPVLRQLLPRAYYRHWMLFVNAIRLVSQKEITDEAIEIAYVLANDFVLTAEELYGVEEISSNMHKVLHAIEFVKKWGALWATSAFMFESELAKIKRFYHGSKAIEKQIFGFHLMRNKLRSYASKYIPFASDAIRELYEKMDGPIVALTDLPNSSEALGRGVIFQLDAHKQQELQHMIGREVFFSRSFSYRRTFFNGKVYSTAAYCVDQRRDNSLVVIQNDRTVRIDSIVELVLECNCRESGERCAMETYRRRQRDIVFFGTVLPFQRLPAMRHAATDNYNLSEILSFMPVNHHPAPEQSIAFRPSDIVCKCILTTKGAYMYRVLVDVRMELD